MGVNPSGHFLWDAQTADEQLRRYAALCAEDASCSRRTRDLAHSVHSAFDRMPSRWLFLPIDEAPAPLPKPSDGVEPSTPSLQGGGQVLAQQGNA